uniref:ADP/ATP translocase n=1 Tax=Ditylenchus dipsaci TaxID=166011 RepID=A0A915DSA7_9BILA
MASPLTSERNTDSFAIVLKNKFLIDMMSAGSAAAGAKFGLAFVQNVKMTPKLSDVYYTSAATDQHKYKAILKILTQTPKERNSAALWQANFIRCCSTQSLNFAFKDSYKELYFKGDERNMGFLKVFGGNLAMGGAAGATSLCFVYPLDVVCNRYAVSIGSSGKQEFKGLTHCTMKIAKFNGLASFYRGFFVSLQGIIIYRATYFGLFDTAKLLLTSDGQKLNFFTAWAIAQVVTAFAECISHPWDVVRRRMIIQSGRKDILYKNSLDCAVTLFKNEGHMFKGALLNMYRSIGGAFVMAIYEEIHKYL